GRSDGSQTAWCTTTTRLAPRAEGPLVDAGARAAGVAAGAAAGGGGQALGRPRPGGAHREDGQEPLNVFAFALRTPDLRAARNEHLEPCVADSAAILEERHSNILARELQQVLTPG